MYRTMTLIILILVLICGALLFSKPILAQFSPNYNLEWHTLGGGGRPVSSASYKVNSTIGQGIASPPNSQSMSYIISGGYWIPAFYHIYIPLTHK
jgi:hypothetical protein